MKKRLNTTFGFYSPSFLRMHVDTDKSLQNLNILTDIEAESVYLHEYTHFIQDISTVYGLANISVIVDYMKFVNNDIIGNPAGAFQLPVMPIPGALDNVDANLEMQKLYNGDGEDHGVTLVAHRKRNKNVLTNLGNQPVDYIEVDYIDVAGNNQSFDFGALSIVENMAYIVESNCYPGCQPSPDLPYSAAEKLVEIIYPAFGANRLNVLALCDISLNMFNPGLFFYDTLIDFQTNGLTFNQPEDIYQQVYNNQPIFNFNGAINFNLLLDAQANLAKQQITGYFNDNYFLPLKSWLNSMIDNAVNYRKANPYFILNIARGGEIKLNVSFKQFMKRVGTPLVTNKYGETTLFRPQNSDNLNYPIIWAINQIFLVMWGVQSHCELAGLCSQGWHKSVNICNKSKPKVDLRCMQQPWERSQDKRKCPFGVMWHHWGLTGYYPI